MHRVALHLGAHKTATTYIQESLARSQEALVRRGIYYIPLPEMRSTITNRIDGTPRLVKKRLRQALGTNNRLILSDENIVGSPGDFLKSGRIYPNLGKRCAFLVRCLPEIEVFFAIREQSTFWPSYYCEMLYHRPFMSWDEFFGAVRSLNFSWFNVVSRLVEVFGEKCLTVWRYENFPSNEDAYFADLCGESIELGKSDRGSRATPSGKAIQLLHAMQTVLSNAEIRKMVWTAANQFPQSDEYPRFVPFEEETRRLLCQGYAADIDAIRSAFPAIRWR